MKVMEQKNDIGVSIKAPFRYSFGYWLARQVHFLAFCVLACIPSMLAGFGFINVYIGGAITFILLFRAKRTEKGWELNYDRYHAEYDSRTSRFIKENLRFLFNCNELKLESYFTYFVILIVTLCIISVFTKSCVTSGNSELGITFQFGANTFTYTTTVIRVILSKRVDCYYKKGPCHAYVSMGQTAATEALLTMHLSSNFSSDSLTLYYDKLDSYKITSMLKYSISPSNTTRIDSIKRIIYTYHLKNLAPETEYKFIAQVRTGTDEVYNHPIYSNITCLLYKQETGVYDQLGCEAIEKSTER